MEERIKRAEKTYEEAYQKIINWEYEEGSMRAEQVLEEIRYQKEFISKLKSFSNSSLFKLKKTSQIFKRQKDIMTTLLLSNGRDEVLINLEKRAKDAKWVAKSKMEKQTKELKKNLSHPINVKQEFIWEREPIHHGRTISWFKGKKNNQILDIVQRLYKGKKIVYIVKQRKWQMLYWAISEDGKPLCPKTKDWKDLIPMFFAKSYKIKGSKLTYETVENSGEYEEIDLEENLETKNNKKTKSEQTKRQKWTGNRPDKKQNQAKSNKTTNSSFAMNVWFSQTNENTTNSFGIGFNYTKKDE